MSRLKFLFAVTLFVRCSFASIAHADDPNDPTEKARAAAATQPETYQVEVISPNGALTRKVCPYTCEDRELPKQHCKTWRSKDNISCYVWDTRLPQDAVPIAGPVPTAKDPLPAAEIK